MKTVCKSIVTGCLAGMFTLVAVATTFAQSSPEPAVVISLAPVKEQLSDINHLVEASGFGQLKFFIKTQVKYYTNGIDATRPAGALLYFEGDNPEPKVVVFLPVKDIDDFLDTVSNLAEVDEEDDFIEISANGESFFATEKGSNVFISQSKESLTDLPEDPQSMLGDMSSKYNIGVQVIGSRIPDELREKAIDLIKDGYLDSLQSMGGDPDQIDKQIADFEEQIKMLSDIDEITFGMATEAEKGKLSMEGIVTGKPGSKVAKSYAGFANPEPSRFAGFMNDKAAMDYNMSFKVLSEDSEQIGDQLDTLIEQMMTELDNDGEFEDAELDTIRSAAVQIAEVIEETYKQGRIDTGGHLMMGENDYNFASGGQVSDPKKIESAAKELIGLLKERAGDVFEFNLDFTKHEGINFHEIVFKVPEDEEELQDYVGPEVIILLGIGEKDVYLAAGKNPMDTLKAAMANSAAAAEYPVVYNVRITPILEYAASTTGQPMLDNFVEKLKELGKDRITAYSKAVENGLFTRVEMEDGILSLIQDAVEGMQGGFGGADF